MSSPSTLSYTADLERRERARERARAAAVEAADRLGQVRADQQRLLAMRPDLLDKVIRTMPADPGPKAEISSQDRYRAALEEMESEARRSLAAAHAQIATERLARVAEGLQFRATDTKSLAPGPSAPIANVSTVPSARERADRVAAMLRELGPGLESNHQAALEALAKQVIEADASAEWSHLRAELRVRVDATNRRLERRRRSRELGHELMRSLRGVDGSEADELRSELRLMTDGGFDPEDAWVQRTGGRIERLRDQAGRDHAANVLRTALAELGYRVGEDFGTLFVKGGVAHFRHSDWKDHVVRFRSDATVNTVHAHLVRIGDPRSKSTVEQRREDAAMEERWCRSLKTAIERVRANGVALRIEKELGPGDVEMPIVQAVERGQIEEAPAPHLTIDAEDRQDRPRHA